MNTIRISKTITILVLFMLPFIAKSQQTLKLDSANISPIVKNNIYIEALGRSLSGYSINYQRNMKYYENSYVALSLGASYLSSYEEEYRISIPISIFYTTHAASNWHGEYGLGFSYLRDNESINDMDDYEILHRATIHASIGLKYQKPAGGLNFKIALTPIHRFFTTGELLDGLDVMVSIVGLSVGYAF